MKLSYLDLKTTDPAWNLAMEQYVFDALPRDRSYFMLWQNDNAIIIGKHQNTLAEINEPYVSACGIRVVRRLSGGGAVYHDLGNLNYTFITDAAESNTLDFHLFCAPVVETLRTFGVAAEVNGRNDITIAGQKFSGSSQYLRGGRVMHHGTILFASDLGVVQEALRVDEEKLRSKGIRSVRSRVTNVSEHLAKPCTLAEFRKALLENVLRENGGEVYPLTETDESAVETLRRERYGTWDWNYGKSPACSIHKKLRFDGCGTVEAHFDVSGGCIQNLQFRGDFFSVEEPEALSQKLLGCRATAEAYAAALTEEEVGRCFVGLRKEQLLRLLTE